MIAGQNWTGSEYSKIAVKIGADPMKLGKGGQNVLFYDVSNPVTPSYMGKLNSCKNGQDIIKTNTDISSLSAAKSGDYYYLSFNGIKSSGIKCRSKVFSPDAEWQLIQEASDNGSCPVSFSFDQHNYIGGARIENKKEVVYESLEFAPDENILTEATNEVSRKGITSSPIPEHSFFDGATFNLCSMENGKSYIVIANVESDERIEIGEIESLD